MASLWVRLNAAWNNVVTGTGTNGKLAKWTGTYTQGDATNTDTDVADAVTKKHTAGTDTALGAVGTKNPPIDADKALYRDSAASDALVTSTWTQVKAFLKTYWDTLYAAVTHATQHAVGGTDTVFPADPNADRYLMWDDDPGALVWAAGGAGDVATDAIWDAKGDLAVGTGANTAAKLTVGADGKYLKAASGEATGLMWDTPAGGAGNDMVAQTLAWLGV